MHANPYGYGALTVDWVTPAGAWTELRLIRNSYGVPVSQEDGVVLLSQRSGPSVPIAQRQAATRVVIDRNLKGGRFQYYAIYLYADTGEWTRAAECTGLPLLDYGYSNRLWDLTPSILRTKTSSLLDADNTELASFEKVFAFQLDRTRAELDTLRDVNVAEDVSGNLLPVMAQQLGVFFERELGMKQMRTLLRDAIHLYRTKGTIPGIEGFVSSLTGWGAKVQPRKNLMLDYNDSSAEESVGNWTYEVSMSRYIPDNIINAVPDAVVSAANMRNKGIFKLTSTAAVNTRARTPAVGTEPGITRGIPVTGGQQYTFSGYARSALGLNAFVTIFWMDKGGNYITENAGVAVVTADNWTARPAITVTAPAAAVYAGVGANFTATAANQVVYWDAFQFETGAVASPFLDARLIDIYAIAPRVNRLINPNFETDIASWIVPAGFTPARTTAQFHSGTASMSLTAGAGALTDYIAYSTNAPAGFAVSAAGDVVTASVWIKAPASRQVRIGVVFVNAAGTDLVGELNGPPVASTGTWQRISVTSAVAPTGTAGAYLLVRSNGTAVNGDVFYLDDALIERGAALQPYFDGNTYAFTGESIWEGTGNASRSHYYPQRRTKNYRLTALMPSYTPAGSSFRVRYAQPGT